MNITIGEKSIQAKIMEKEEAKVKYDDAIAAGNSAALMNESKDNTLSLQIGNVLPGQTALVEIEIIQPVEITGGAFDFIFPMDYFPELSDT
jgi:Ca-activated chloride channel family protein